MSIKILHLINPFALRDEHAKKLMELTFESITLAIQNCPEELEVKVLGVSDVREKIEVPHFIQPQPSNLQTLKDLYPGQISLAFPLMQDLLHVAFNHDFDYLIYTNMDIILQPHFYRFLATQLPEHDALVINRRRLADRKPLPNLAELQSELGWSHPGFDCFVLERSLVEQFNFGQICVGVPFIESAFTHQIAAFASKPKYVLDAHLTLHVGLEILPKVNKAAYWHNRNEFFKKIQPRLKNKYRLSAFPYAQEATLLRALKWMLNPSLYTKNYLKLEFASRKKRWTLRMQSWRWRFLQR